MQCGMGAQTMADLQRMDLDMPGSEGREEHIERSAVRITAKVGSGENCGVEEMGEGVCGK